MKRSILGLVLLASCGTVDPPAAFGPVPTPQQMEWQRMEYYMFAHFGPNTFTDVEWGDGREDPSVFRPTALDCRQWAATARAAGMTGIILTAKHHDGFCLWPSAQSTHTVREAGAPDVVKLLSEACKAEGIKFGVYVSPWDQNHPTYGKPEYNRVYANTLEEVLSGYGPVFEMWFDGANGGEHVPPYDWPMFHEVVTRLQPNAVMFSDIGPGCRWIGNENGMAGETNWSTLNVAGFTPGKGAPAAEVLNAGVMGGEAWVPGEADVSIRPGWFYSPSTDDKVKTVGELMDIWCGSVGRNAALLLNVPPDRRGQIAAADSIRLMEFRAMRDSIFGQNLAMNAHATASSTHGRGYGAERLTDGDFDTYWAAAPDQSSASVEIDLGGEKSVSAIALQEYVALGQRVRSFTVSALVGGEWLAAAQATTIGYKRILRFDPIQTARIKVDFEAMAPPVVSSVEVF